MAELVRRPLPRFVFWALVLVVLALATGLAGLDWWAIALVEFAAWALITMVERTIWQRTNTPEEP